MKKCFAMLKKKQTHILLQIMNQQTQSTMRDALQKSNSESLRLKHGIHPLIHRNMQGNFGCLICSGLFLSNNKSVEYSIILFLFYGSD